MIDLHQGFSGRELEELEPGVGAVAVLQLDTVMAAAKGEYRRAAQGQVAVAKLVGQLMWRGLQQRARSLVK